MDAALDAPSEGDGSFPIDEDSSLPASGAASGDGGRPGADAGSHLDAGTQAPGGTSDGGLLGDLDAGSLSEAGLADAESAPCAWGDFEAPEEITGLQVAGEVWGPALSADRLTLYFAENDGIDERIMQATRSDLGASFSPAVEVPNVQSAAYDGTPFVSADGLSLYLYSSRPGGVGNRDLWIARRTTPTGSFDVPTLLPVVNSAAADHLPRLSADGLTLIFSSGRVTNPGGTDIWQARRASPSSAFGTPTLVGELSTSDYDGAASLSSDGLAIVFSSDRPGGLGDKDLWIATRDNSASIFGPARNLTIANSDSSDADCVLSADDRELIFSSGRGGTRKLWRVVQNCR